MNKAKILGFGRVFNVTNKETGEVYKKINVSVAIPDPNYQSGERAAELYLTVNDTFKYDWLEVGQEVLLGYNRWGKIDCIDLA